MINVAIIGFGYWGPNLARNFHALPNARLQWICDVDGPQLRRAKKLYPNVATTQNIRDVLRDTNTDAVVIATPISTHVPISTAFLNAGKHVLVEKPLAASIKEARSLVSLAKSKKRILAVDHTYLYTPEIEAIADYIASGKLGRIFFVDSIRTNLGLIQKDSNVIFDLATHDFSILDFLFGATPNNISATGFSPKNVHQEAVAYITAQYPRNIFFHSHVSWLSPVKIRTMIFVGTKKMLVYNDMEQTEKIKIYDTGIDVRQRRIGYRIGSVVSPHLPITEALTGMANDFISAITKKKKPRSNGEMGVRVVAAIEAATASIRL